MNTLRIREIGTDQGVGDTVRVEGWVRTRRTTKHVSFMEVNDGSRLGSLQVVLEENTRVVDSSGEDAAASLTTGASVRVDGTLQDSPGGKQAVELLAERVEVVGKASGDTYPLQKKRHSFEFLREIAHLRPRTNTFGAVTRVRNVVSREVHRWFQERDFCWIHTPIITGIDAEGAGNLFRVTTMDPENPPRTETGDIDWSQDFFEQPAYLAVTGQLNVEAFACSVERAYTFGPTFRAENSNTTRHLSEFWMVEPEVAFCDLDCNCDLAESFLKGVVSALLEQADEDMRFFDLRIKNGLIDMLRSVVDSPFERITYTRAIELLKESDRSFEFTPQWGSDLQSEHERYLTEEAIGRPVIVTDYPKDIKAFYMKQNDDGRTVRAMDVLVPGLGEVIGGSEREDDLEKLEGRMHELGMDPEAYRWYLDLRRFGSVPHSGFGLGLERFIMYVTGMQNIRDVIAFPRTPGNVSF
ncbi:MAG: asparagine--tRNA ligase [Spirochaetales bacterium]